jgi:hypothetical protein
MSLTISVYEKRGLKRGPAITNAYFAAVSTIGIVYNIPPRATGGGPLGGATYQVQTPGGLENSSWTLRVASPQHNAWDFTVRDRETHDVWLTRR